jgi:hypothetical protein
MEKLNKSNNTTPKPYRRKKPSHSLRKSMNTSLDSETYAYLQRLVEEMEILVTNIEDVKNFFTSTNT